MTPRKRVLLIEDDPSDVMFMREAFKSASVEADIDVARDGEEAMACLRGSPPFEGTPRPALVLLDWRLPKKSGKEVLTEIRADPFLKLIPVLVLTTSASDEDAGAAYALGANAFLTKPTGLEKLRTLACLIVDFWLVCATLPSELRSSSGRRRE